MFASHSVTPQHSFFFVGKRVSGSWPGVIPRESTHVVLLVDMTGEPTSDRPIVLFRRSRPQHVQRPSTAYPCRRSCGAGPGDRPPVPPALGVRRNRVERHLDVSDPDGEVVGGSRTGRGGPGFRAAATSPGSSQVGVGVEVKGDSLVRVPMMVLLRLDLLSLPEHTHPDFLRIVLRPRPLADSPK